MKLNLKTFHFENNQKQNYIENSKILNSKKLRITSKIIVTSLIFMISLSMPTFAATAKIISKIESALNTISKWIVRIATPAAAVAIGSGLLIKKFSFGDEERMSTGKKIIRNSLFSYAFILVIDLVLDAIKSIVT